VRSIAFSPDGQLIAGGRGDGRIEIWHLNSGRRLAILYGHSDAVYTLAFDPQGQRLVSGGGPLDPTIKLWQLSTGELLQVIESHTGTVHSLAIAADGKRLVSGSEDNTIQLWQLHSP
jgi:WD40 repeat protein